MGNKKSDYNVLREVTGTRPPGATRPNPPQSRVLQATPAQDMGEGDAHQIPRAAATGPTSMWFNTTAEFDRWYRRLHPMRFSIARRLDRIEREQQREREINTIRDLTRGRHGILQQIGNPRFRQELVERNAQRQRDEDPLNQFNRRVRRRFEEAMAREANDLADELQALRISPPTPPTPPSPFIGPIEEVD